MLVFLSIIVILIIMAISIAWPKKRYHYSKQGCNYLCECYEKCGRSVFKYDCIGEPINLSGRRGGGYLSKKYRCDYYISINDMKNYIVRY